MNKILLYFIDVLSISGLLLILWSSLFFVESEYDRKCKWQHEVNKVTDECKAWSEYGTN